MSHCYPYLDEFVFSNQLALPSQSQLVVVAFHDAVFSQLRTFPLLAGEIWSKRECARTREREAYHKCWWYNGSVTSRSIVL